MATEKTARVPRPPRFKGLPGDDIASFEAQCKKIVDVHKLTGDEARDWVLEQLGGEAYVKALDMYHDQCTMDQILGEMKILYGKSEVEGRLHEKFWAMKQLAKPATFLQDIRKAPPERKDRPAE